MFSGADISGRRHCNRDINIGMFSIPKKVNGPILQENKKKGARIGLPWISE